MQQLVNNSTVVFTVDHVLFIPTNSMVLSMIIISTFTEVDYIIMSDFYDKIDDELYGRDHNLKNPALFSNNMTIVVYY